MLKEILILAGIMFLPFVEIRVAIPVGILTGVINLPFGITLSGFGFDPVFVLVLACLMGPFLAFILFNLLHLFGHKLENSRYSRKYMKILYRSQKRIKPLVDKYGIWGMAFYISLPFPGSGIYSGSIGGYMIGMEKKKFYLAAVIGAAFAALIVTIVTVLGTRIF